MGKWVALQVVGMVLLAVGAQGAIRVLIHHSDRGLTSWLSGGFGTTLAADLVLVVVGGTLAWLGDARRRESPQA